METKIIEEMRERLNTLSSVIDKSKLGNFHETKQGLGLIWWIEFEKKVNIVSPPKKEM